MLVLKCRFSEIRKVVQVILNLSQADIYKPQLLYDTKLFQRLMQTDRQKKSSATLVNKIHTYIIT
jgi:hypothetical protein